MNSNTPELPNGTQSDNRLSVTNYGGLTAAISHQKGAAKTRSIPIPVVVDNSDARLPKPDWIRVHLPTGQTQYQAVKKILRDRQLHTVCEEASCPNIGECFGKGTATFMIMGDQCTRRCPFCDVGHGRPEPLDPNEPAHLAEAIVALGLRYVVITSVDRDDLLDGGAEHFVRCIESVRLMSPQTKIEILTPDFRGRLDRALSILYRAPPDVMNHNLETVPRLYKAVRPGSNYQHSLQLLLQFKQHCPTVPTKSGLMLGLGETDDEIISTLQDLRDHQVEMVTIGQYLQPTRHHLPVQRYVNPEIFKELEEKAKKMGFANVASGPLVRSSYHADQQAERLAVTST